MAQCFNTFLLLIPYKNGITHIAHQFSYINNNDATGTIQLGRDMPNLTFMHLQLLRKEW